jgi:hypothetical protein
MNNRGHNSITTPLKSLPDGLHRTTNVEETAEHSYWIFRSSVGSESAMLYGHCVAVPGYHKARKLSWIGVAVDLSLADATSKKPAAHGNEAL